MVGRGTRTEDRGGLVMKEEIMPYDIDETDELLEMARDNITNLWETILDVLLSTPDNSGWQGLYTIEEKQKSIQLLNSLTASDIALLVENISLVRRYIADQQSLEKRDKGE